MNKKVIIVIAIVVVIAAIVGVVYLTGGKNANVNIDEVNTQIARKSRF